MADRFGLSPRSCRLLGEALADWRHEVAVATSDVARLRAHALGTVGLGRVVAVIGAREAWAPNTRTWFWRALACAVAVAVLPLMSRGIEDLSQPNVLWSTVLSMVMALIRRWPECVFVAVAMSTRHRHASATGGAVLMTIASVAFGLAGALVWRQYAEVGLLRPGLAQPGVPAFQMGLYAAIQVVGAVLLADRVRQDRQRWQILGAVCAVAWLLLALNGRVFAMPAGVLVSRLSTAFAPVVQMPPVTLLIWWLLVRRQEKQKASAALARH